MRWRVSVNLTWVLATARIRILFSKAFIARARKYQVHISHSTSTQDRK
jgi:hypothetical protein